MSKKIYKPQEDIQNPYIKDFDEYKTMYLDSVNQPEKFFGDMAESNIDWIEPFEQVHNGDFANTAWFDGGKLNLSIKYLLVKNVHKVSFMDLQCFLFPRKIAELLISLYK